MTDTSQFVPSVQRGGGSTRSSVQDNAMEVGTRVRLLTQVNPYMSDRADVLLQMAQSSLDTPQLIEQSAQMYGMMAADTFASRLKGMSPGTQRSIWNTLPKAQQLALEQMQYQPPQTREESWLGKALAPIDYALGPVDEAAGKVIGAGVRGLGDVAGPVLNPTLRGLAWVGDRPAHIYRTIRTMDDGAQWAGLAGAIVGGLAVAAALPTGGASLLVAGAVGLGATAGAGAASFLESSMVGNGADWFRAFKDSYHGEQTFDRPSREKADDLLGDPRMVGLAQDMANLEGFSVNEFATELAGMRDDTLNSQLGKVQELALRFGEAGTPEFQQAYSSMLNALQEPLFLEAVTALQQGKISIGRDLADVFQLDPESGIHSAVSGMIDAAFIIAVDPTIMLGGASKWVRARQLGVRVGAEGSVAAEQFLRVAADPRRVRYDEAFLEAFNSGNVQRLSSMTPEMLREVPALHQYRQSLKAYGVINSYEDFDRSHLLAYFTGAANLAPLMRGVGTVRGAQGIVLKGLTRRGQFARELMSSTRNFVGALNDPRLERHIDGLIDAATKRGDVEVASKLGLIRSNAVDLETGRLYGKHQLAANMGRAVGNTIGRLPLVGRVPEVLESITTMIPAGRSIRLVGEEAPRDVKALAELGRYMGMPSYHRRLWADSILFSDNVAGRMNAVHGWLDNGLTIAGGRQTEQIAKLTDEYLARSMQTYGIGDEVVVNGRPLKLGLFLNEQADEIVMPSLHELHRAAATGHMGQMLGALDANVVESAITKIWKPAVLLRIGFIPRAAGEEMLNFMFRGGFGSLVQEFGARSIARKKVYEEAVAKRLRDPRSLTTAEDALLAEGPIGQLPTHIRLVARMLGGYDWAEPVVDSIFHYSNWVRGLQETGLPGIRRLEAPAQAIKGSIAGVDSVARTNLAGNLDSILGGSRHSWRRMMGGGVHDEKVLAAIAYQQAHATALMRRVSTRSAGVWDPGYDETQVQKRMMLKDGVLVEQPTMVLKGQPGIYGKTDWEYAHGFHHDAVTKVEDAIGGHVAKRYLPRMRGGTTLTDDEIDRIFDLAERAQMDVPKRVLHEFAGADDAEHVRVMVAELEKVEPEVAQHLAAFLPKSGPISIDDVVEAVEILAATNKGHGFEQVMNRMVDELHSVRELEAILRPLDADTRAFAAAIIRSAEPDQPTGLATLWREHRSNVRGSTPEPGMVRLYRGRYAPGGQVPGPTGPMPDWLAAQPELETRRQLTGRWFTDDPDVARRYPANMEPGEVSELAYVDVPQRIYDQVKGLADQPDEVRRLSMSPDREVVLPPEIASTARTVDEPVQSPFVDRWDDLQEAIIADVRNRVQHVQHQDQLMHSQRVAGLADDDPLKEGTLLAWRAPSLRRFRSVDEVLQASTNHEIIERNRDLITRLMHEPGDRIGLLADRELAEQLGIITGAPVRAHSLARSARNGRAELDGGLVPAVKYDDEVAMWSADQRMFPAESSSVYQDLDDRAQEMAEQMVGRMRQLWTRGTVQQNVARSRRAVDEAGEVIDTPLLFTRNPMTRESALEAVEPGDTLVQGRTYFNDKGERVDVDRPEYSHSQEFSAGQGSVMWPLMGPMIEDSRDAAEGLVKFRAKSDITFRRGEIIPSNDVVPMYRSNPSHVLDVGEGLPTHVTAPSIAALEQSTWERFVRWGFDSVIGPSIDALARQPMAFHFFSERYAFSKQAQSLLWDPELTAKVNATAERLSKVEVDVDVDELLMGARQIAAADGKIPEALHWTTARTSAWLRGHSAEELDQLLAGVIMRNTGKAGPEERTALAAAVQLRGKGVDTLLGTAGTQLPTGDDLIAYVASKIPPRDLASRDTLFHSDRALETIYDDQIMSKLTDEDWDNLLAAHRNRQWADEAAGEYAATAAINDMLPFIDSHEFKTQFAEMGRGFLPFWYAEENFLKRWGRTLIDQGTLPTIRKAQLGYMGLKNAGVVRTDQSGRDYFVYPGSTMLTEVVSKIIPGGLLPVGAMFQTPTSSMLPGMNESFGTPSFSPLVSFPMGVVEAWVPEIEPLQRALLGDYAASRSAWEQLVPTQVQNFFEAVTSSEESSQRYSSAMLSAIAMLAAEGKAPADDASPGQVDEFMRKVRAHARIIMVSQALTGFVAPGGPSQMIAGQSANISGIGIDDPRGTLSAGYQELIRNLGIEQGTIEYLKLYPLANLEDIVNPLALTEGQTKSASGAPLPATKEAVAFYDANEQYMQEFPDAGPWILPQDQSGKGARSQYAYDQQTINGLRQRQTGEEFLTSIKFKEAAGPYFTKRTEYLDAVDRATLAKDSVAVDQAKQRWEVYSSTWKAAHPIFAEELESSAGRQRRGRVIQQLGVIVRDNLAPKAAHFEAVASMVRSYQNYKLQLAILSEDRSAKGRAKVEQLKAGFSDHMTGFVLQFPETQPLWNSVLRPESSLD